MRRRKSLYSFLGVPKNTDLHWFDSSSWVMVEFMYAQMINKILGIDSTFNYAVLTCDELNIVDIKSWISIHAYVMQNWVKLPMMIFLQKFVDGARVDTSPLSSWRPYRMVEA
jgi:deoxyribodipyrimidine photolyase-like uncharacterized protein